MQLLLNPDFMLGAAVALLLAAAILLALLLAAIGPELCAWAMDTWRRYRARRRARREVRALARQVEFLSRSAAEASQAARPNLAAAYRQAARSCSRRAFALSHAHQAVRP